MESYDFSVEGHVGFDDAQNCTICCTKGNGRTSLIDVAHAIAAFRLDQEREPIIGSYHNQFLQTELSSHCNTALCLEEIFQFYPTCKHYSSIECLSVILVMP